jgi:ketosteroid isomerase-like protein
MTQATLAEVRDVIVVANETFRTTSKTGDATSMAALYTENGQLLPPKVLDEGKYIVIWKHEDGQWKLHRDILNSSRPAPG